MSRFNGNWDTGQRRNFRRILIVGGGRAGVAAAEEFRRQGFGGEVVVMCEEPDAPYDRPSCSKSILTGHKRPRDAKMPVQEDLAIQWEMGRKAVHLDPENRVVIADNDERYPYDGLVIATGASPNWPKGWPPVGEPGLHQLYGLGHAWSLRKALQRAKRVAVVGGGLTGCEVACSVRKMARQCTLIDSKQQVMARALGEVVGRYVTEEIADDGVELRLGRRVRSVTRRRRGWVLVLDDGSEVEADVVVASVGDRPDVRWLQSSGFDISDGVLCDEHLRVVGAEDVVAAGTVARWPNLRYSPEPRRVGQWIMAMEQGRAAAASLLGSDHPSRPAALIPRYWSDQFGLRIQVCGEVPTDSSAEMTVSRQRPGRRDTARGGVLVGYHRDGEQIGLVGVNAVRAFTTTARMMLAAPPRFVGTQYERPMLMAAQQRPMLPPPPERPMGPPPGYQQPALPPAGPRMLTAEPAQFGPPPEQQYDPRYEQPEPAYGPPPEYGPGYGPAPEYEPAMAQYGPPPEYGAEYGPAPQYEPAAGQYGPPEYGPEYGPPPQYDPAYGPPPQYDPAYGPPPQYDPAYGPPPQYDPAYGPPQYDPAYGPPPPEQPPYDPAGQHGPPQYPAPPYDPMQYDPVRYGPPEYEPPYEPAPYEQVPYEPAVQYGPPQPSPAPAPPPNGRHRHDYPEGYPPPQQAPVSPPWAGQPGQGPEWPVSPAPRPASSPPRLNPRDRFATDQFAAVR